MFNEELEERFKNDSGLAPSAVIEFKGERGIAIALGENLVTNTWLSGDVIVFWENGEHTMLPEEQEFELIHYNAYRP